MQRFLSGKPIPIFIISPLVFIIASFYSIHTQANDEMDVIEVHGTKSNQSDYLGSVDALLKEQGVDFSAAGGMSNLPILNGMLGDRVKVLVDGADFTASCANHMNPPLSYISASQVQTLNVVAGISPVSVAGDNIAGVISVNSIDPQFTDGNSLAWHSGFVSGQYRSNSDAESIGVGASWASASVNIDYQGAFTDAKSYEDGQGNKVLDTLYQAQNHSLTAAFKDQDQQLAVKLSHQSIPFQGFPNQYMDMTDNSSFGLTVQYQLQIDKGEFEAQFNWHHVKHEMGFFTDEKTGMMPMSTDAKDISYKLQWRLDINTDNSLTLGHAYHDYQIDDWWPAVAGSLMMGPNDYININDGHRQRFAVYAELDQQLSDKWQVSSGVRIERVRTDTDDVQGYMDDMSMGMNPSMGMGGMIDINAAAANKFNDLDREQSDTLVDVSLLASYKLNNNESIEIGIARKNRAPNLYERYTWGLSTMATTMIGWFGDGNGYVGDPNLKPETAHTASASYVLNADDDIWQFNANLWYTQVNDYIDATIISSFNKADTDISKRNILQFTNVDATLYGSRLNASYKFSDSKSLGEWKFTGQLVTTHGERDDSDEPMYQIKPLQTEIALHQHLGKWQNTLEWQFIDEKSRVDSRRLENTTDSYHLFNVNSRYSLGDIKLTVSITNLLDEYYVSPLGGVSIAEFKRDPTQGYTQLAGAGRSFNFGVNYSF